MERKYGSRGFTIAELLIVVAIIGVLVAVAIPVFGLATKNAEETACLSNRTSLTRELIIEQMTRRELNTQELAQRAKEIGTSCPTTGTYTVEKNGKGEVRVTCSKHGLTEGGGGADNDLPIKETPNKVAAAIKKIVDAYLDSNPNGYISNDIARRTMFEQIGRWPELTIEYGDTTRTVYIQPYYNAKTKTYLAYANATQTAQGNWRASHIYDSSTGIWYSKSIEKGVPNTNTINVADRPWEEIYADIQKEQWVPVTDYGRYVEEEFSMPE